MGSNGRKELIDIFIPQSPWLAPCPRCRAEGGSRLAGVCMECAAGDVAACAALRRLPARERAIVADVLGAAGLVGLERVTREGEVRTQKAEQERLERIARRATRNTRNQARKPINVTARDKEILDEIAKGLTYHEIGAALGISHQRISQVANKHGIMRGRGVHVNRKEPVKRMCAQCGRLTTNPKFCNLRCWGMANKNNAFNAKLTADQVVEIRKLLAQGMPLTRIAELFPVTVSEISHINTGRTWGYLQ